jgi:DNA-binding HxlR family transcriptional regulator
MAKNKDYTTWVEAALDVIGGKWKPLIVLALKDGTQRYSEVAHKLPGIGERMLVKQLRELERDGIIKRTVYAQVPPRVEYSLTLSGKKLMPVLKILSIWCVNYLGRDVVGDGPSVAPWGDPAQLRLLLEDLDSMRKDVDKRLKRLGGTVVSAGH